jgi:hypothetical protein
MIVVEGWKRGLRTYVTQCQHHNSSPRSLSRLFGNLTLIETNCSNGLTDLFGLVLLKKPQNFEAAGSVDDLVLDESHNVLTFCGLDDELGIGFEQFRVQGGDVRHEGRNLALPEHHSGLLE